MLNPASEYSQHYKHVLLLDFQDQNQHSYSNTASYRGFKSPVFWSDPAGALLTKWWGGLERFPTLTSMLRQGELHRWLSGHEENMQVGMCLLPPCLRVDPAIERGEV